jgi:coenzyme PQQ biosynthesis protein B
VRARSGDRAVPPRSQPGIAVSADGQRWSLLNANPDLRAQLAAFSGLHPRPGTRDVPLDTIALTSAELDHVIGLLMLREALCYRIVSTAWVRDAILGHNAAWRLLEPAWGIVKLDEPIRLDREGALQARLFPVPGKVPGYLRDASPTPAPDTESRMSRDCAPSTRAPSRSSRRRAATSSTAPSSRATSCARCGPARPTPWPWATCP